jgi:EpsI family protein
MSETNYSIQRLHARWSWPHLAVGMAMIAAYGVAIALTPTRYEVAEGTVDLEKMIPRAFGDWTEVKTAAIQIDLSPRDGEERSTNQPYDQTLMRSYVRKDGAMVMLAVAYGRTQRQEVKIHRPELCYVAQGFDIGRKELVDLDLGGRSNLPVYRLVTHNDRRTEPVTYWIRIGDKISTSAWQSRWRILVEGLHGRIPDGILVRVSQVVPSLREADESYVLQQTFLRDLSGSVDLPTRKLLIGA